MIKITMHLIEGIESKLRTKGASNLTPVKVELKASERAAILYLLQEAKEWQEKVDLSY